MDETKSTDNGPATPPTEPLQFGLKRLLGGMLWLAILFAIARQAPTRVWIPLFLIWFSLMPVVFDWPRLHRIGAAPLLLLTTFYSSLLLVLLFLSG